MPSPTVLRRNPKVEEAPLSGELMLFEPATSRFFVLNRTMAFVWSRCDGGSTVDALLDALERGELDAALTNTPEATRDPKQPWLLTPIDLQAVKAAGVTFARSMVAEMHSGYLSLRRQCPMNVRRRVENAQIDDDARADIVRILTLWAEARARFGKGGPYLFGSFCAADIIYAPVVSRFITYGVPVPGFAVPTSTMPSRRLCNGAFHRCRATCPPETSTASLLPAISSPRDACAAGRSCSCYGASLSGPGMSLGSDSAISTGRRVCCISEAKHAVRFDCHSRRTSAMPL